MQTDAAALAAALRDLLAEDAAIWIPAEAATNRAALASLLDEFEAAARGEPDAATRALAAEVAEWRELLGPAIPLQIARLEGLRGTAAGRRQDGEIKPRSLRERERRARRSGNKLERLRALLRKVEGDEGAAEEAATE